MWGQAVPFGRIRAGPGCPSSAARTLYSTPTITGSPGTLSPATTAARHSPNPASNCPNRISPNSAGHPARFLRARLHQRTSSHDIPGRMMMQRHRRLNQSLQESLLQPMRLPPHILPNLMRVIKLPRIEVSNPYPIPLPKSHALILRLDRMNARESDPGVCGAGALARDCRRKGQHQDGGVP